MILIASGSITLDLNSQAHPDPAVTPWSSSTVRMSSDKMKSIMRFLDAVEAEQATTSIASSLNGVTATQDPKVAFLSLLLSLTRALLILNLLVVKSGGQQQARKDNSCRW